MLELLASIPVDRPVLIAGPTASGKSALALAVARAGGGRIVNADALQVFADWRVLTARPAPEEEAKAPHALYGHVPWGRAYSVGDWLRDVAPLLSGGPRPIVVGGTGLYFRALTEGLAEIPPTPPDIRAEAEARLAAIGLDAMGRELAPDVRADLDLANPMRVLRAWEVARATGRSIRDWQADTPPPLLPRAAATSLVIDAPKDWLTPRIERRFDAMLAGGALAEARAVLPRWDPALNAARAIGAAELVAHLRGEIDLTTARDRAIVATRRYAKRQRTWFRARMRDWRRIDATAL
ncbi:tRNA (adenosine(37)-N6)-dimethylallyltransferase MiaA [uncultured Jannaschia sp.]|uniref:tRNA (adenosine(37)-N6)-dimethylallyltransferase MiaA n=1 Tax=uncultured Jannaschia sp. TaxID=293347 RepID=UPI002632B2BF|nr:tRNA (adenosine(37)-N6)-dimethylallyltransferase MiaA [uncultured Jannaschia sp.]